MIYKIELTYFHVIEKIWRLDYFDFENMTGITNLLHNYYIYLLEYLMRKYPDNISEL